MQEKYQTRLSNLEDMESHTPYSHSILSAVNTCPMWGVIHYGLRKSYSSDARAMALEFGSAAHEVFAAVYLWQLGHVQNLPDHMHFHGRRVYNNTDRFELALKETNPKEDRREQLTTLAFNIINSGDFYDDPFDNIRTKHNLEMGAIKYIDNVAEQMERWPIWVDDENNPEDDVGVELSLDFMLKRGKSEMRYIGQADRVHDVERTGPDGKAKREIILGENKTGARLDNAWALSFDMSNQVTGYLLGLSTRLGEFVTASRVYGVKTKQTGAAEDFNPISPQRRTTEAFERFIDWAFDARQSYEKYSKDYESAPRYTHSCSRYFRPCSLITFCGDTAEGRAQQLEQMEATALSPSEQAVMDREV